jgi:hypothetical protein
MRVQVRRLGPNDLPRVGWRALSENPLNPSQSEKDVANKYGHATKSGATYRRRYSNSGPCCSLAIKCVRAKKPRNISLLVE